MTIRFRSHGWTVLGALVATVVMASGCRSSRWDEHDSHRWCRPALDDAPGAPDLTCDALHMCANEVDLDEEDTARLQDALTRLDCAEP